MDTDINQLLAAVSQVGQYLIFLYLYLAERKAHEVTRADYRDDLRGWAGIQDNAKRPG